MKNLVAEAKHAKRLAALRAALVAELKRTNAPTAIVPQP